ncbi:MAG: PorP/SprF family type IX secretion system membrane protein [Bacteroidales bacterium]|nr:PorP/SprF family type IX secretion system membrane protein [Bacteroidales bacterium]
MQTSFSENRSMYKRGIIIGLIMLAAAVCMAQDAHFSRFYSNSLYLAPSFAGNTGKNRLAASYRDQWSGIEVGYKTYSFSFDHNFSKLNSGFGFLFFKDEAGSGNLSTTNIGLLYNYDFKITNWVHIRPGMSFLYTQRGIDFNKLLWGDQLSVAGTAPTSGEVVSYNSAGDVDFSASLLSYGDKFWAGFTLDHLLRPNQSLYFQEFNDENQARVPIKFQFYGGTKHVVKESLLRPKPTTIQLAYLYKRQADFQQLDMGFYYYYSPIVLGIWYRGIPVINDFNVNDAVVLLVGLKTDNYNIGYSYDFTVSKLIIASGGSHEVSLSYNFGMPAKKKRLKKMVPCPEF